MHIIIGAHCTCTSAHAHQPGVGVLGCFLPSDDAIVLVGRAAQPVVDTDVTDGARLHAAPQSASVRLIRDQLDEYVLLGHDVRGWCAARELVEQTRGVDVDVVSSREVELVAAENQIRLRFVGLWMVWDESEIAVNYQANYRWRWFAPFLSFYP